MIPNQWYPILEPREVRDRPVAVRRLGEDLVVWRRPDRSLVCQVDRCAHKGARLSLGQVVGDSIQCPYHGFRYDASGACVAAPCLGKQAKIPGALCVRGYPVREAHGWIWMYWGEARGELPELPVPPEIAGSDRVYADLCWDRRAHYTRYIESLLEFYHITWVHRGHWFNYVDYMFLYGTARKLGLDGRDRYLAATKIANYTCQVSGDRIDSSFDLVNEDDPSYPGEHYEIVFQAPNLVLVKNKQFDAAAWLTPIDDENTRFMLRWYEYPQLRSWLPTRGLRRVLPSMSCYMEKWVQDLQDFRVIRSQTPTISAIGASKFVAPDEMNARYLAMRKRLVEQATSSAAPPARGPHPELHATA